MVWQDIVITLCSVLFGYSLIPQIIHGFKKKKGFIQIQTSLLTAIGLSATALCYFTLGMILAGITGVIMAILWGILLFQKIKYK